MPTVPDIHRRGTRAAQAGLASLTIGTLYFVTDESVTERWTGTVWESYSGAAATALTTAQKTRALTFLFDNGASDLAVGTKTLPVSCPYAGTITAARLLSPQTGAVVLDVWKAAYASYPPTVANTITAAAKPTLSAANKADVTLTGWTTAVAAGDVLLVNVDSATGVRACALQLTLVVP